MSEKNKRVTSTDQSTTQPNNEPNIIKNVQDNYIPHKADLQQKIDLNAFPYAEILNAIGSASGAGGVMYGADRAIHLSELCTITGLNSRNVRKAIEKMRRAGVVIASGENGYFIPETATELERYIRRTEKTARSIFYTLKAARTLQKSVSKESVKYGK